MDSATNILTETINYVERLVWLIINK
jgi:hypothetical protein